MLQMSEITYTWLVPHKGKAECGLSAQRQAGGRSVNLDVATSGVHPTQLEPPATSSSRVLSAPVLSLKPEE